jgi:hypothetical protein
MSEPPSCEIRAPKRTSAGCGEILPATRASPSPKVADWSIRLVGTKEKIDEAKPASALELRRISIRLSHCEMTFSCTLLRPLGRYEQVQPELPALGGDANGVAGGDGRQRVLRAFGADVVRLVDHDQHRVAVGPPLPQPAEHRRRRERLLLTSGERAEVDHEEPHGRVDDRIQ